MAFLPDHVIARDDISENIPDVCPGQWLLVDGRPQGPGSYSFHFGDGLRR